MTNRPSREAIAAAFRQVEANEALATAPEEFEVLQLIHFRGGRGLHAVAAWERPPIPGNLLTGVIVGERARTPVTPAGWTRLSQRTIGAGPTYSHYLMLATPGVVAFYAKAAPDIAWIVTAAELQWKGVRGDAWELLTRWLEAS